MAKVFISKDKILEVEEQLAEDGRRRVILTVDASSLDELLVPPPATITGHREHLCKFITDNPAPPTKESVVIPEPTPTQFEEQVLRMEEIVSHLNRVVSPTSCDDMRTVDGATQTGGKKAETIISHTLTELGYHYTKASSQQPVDFRDIRKPSDPTDYPSLYLDSKKTDGTTIVLNDSVPKMHMWYIVMFTKMKRFVAIHCNLLRKDPAVESTLMEYKRIIECLRHTYKKFGIYRAAARMNLSLDLKDYQRDTTTNVFY